MALYSIIIIIINTFCFYKIISFVSQIGFSVLKLFHHINLAVLAFFGEDTLICVSVSLKLFNDINFPFSS